MTDSGVFEIDPKLIENADIRITEDENQELVLEHKTSGQKIKLDREISLSELTTAQEAADAAPVQTEDLEQAVDDSRKYSEGYAPGYLG